MPKHFCPHGKIWTLCEICKQEFIEKEKLAAYSAGKFLTDRNLAFKCNWMDTDYEKPCTEIGRNFNIIDAKHVWCTQPENECRRFQEGKISIVSDEPCYESVIFSKWEFGAGVYHTGKKVGEGKKIHKKMVGKIALLTTNGPDESEDKKTIFGFLRIKDFRSYPDSGATRVVGDKEMSLKIPKDSRLYFWDFYRNQNTPEKKWGSGLFRYLSDDSIEKYLLAQLETLKINGHVPESKIVADILKLYTK